MPARIRRAPRDATHCWPRDLLPVCWAGCGRHGASQCLAHALWCPANTDIGHCTLGKQFLQFNPSSPIHVSILCSFGPSVQQLLHMHIEGSWQTTCGECARGPQSAHLWRVWCAVRREVDKWWTAEACLPGSHHLPQSPPQPRPHLSTSHIDFHTHGPVLPLLPPPPCQYRLLGQTPPAAAVKRAPDRLTQNQIAFFPRVIFIVNLCRIILIFPAGFFCAKGTLGGL